MNNQQDTFQVMSAKNHLEPGVGVIPPPSQAKINERKKELKLLISSVEKNLQFLNHELAELEKQSPVNRKMKRSKREERFLKYYNKIR